ncbi:alkaline phosphatase family protein [Desemzia sp. RIT804]|uniref:alkaline phosphatase family protein n=1 Tax=Desemzia sp. RIT 804 TaxID=2810209 RepID=UPI00194FFD74|nr:ectonucleotide pyrophosphatase/phosphodiesterase [Desemzia sp. RIT 804]MBM6614471.1 alkaline phosphatase family protein [Desemzia sp. RIT 804]
MRKQRMYIISLDAFGASDLEYAKTLPNFKLLLERSALVEKVETVYPSLTYMAHTSIVTGVYPNKHGVMNNTYLQPGRKSPDWHWYAKGIKVPTLFDAAHEKGYKTASFLWPVTGRSKSIDYNLTEIFPNRPWQNQVMVSLYSSTPKFILELERKFGKLRNGIQQPELDEFLTAGILETIETKNPDLMAIHYVELDSMRHHFGVHSLEAQKSIRNMDKHLGQIIEVMKRKGIFEETIIAILGDHYQIDTHTVIHLNSYFQQLGWIKMKENNQLMNWEVMAKGADGSTYIYTKPGIDLEKVQKALEDFPKGIETIYTQEQAERLGADASCSFLVEAERGYYFADNLGPLFEATEGSDYHKAAHGFSPTKDEYETMMFLSGPGIDPNARVPFARLVDEGPTFLYAMGYEFNHSIDGRILKELFLEDKGGTEDAGNK